MLNKKPIKITTNSYIALLFVLLVVNYVFTPMYISVCKITTVLALLVVHTGITVALGYLFTMLDKKPYAMYSSGNSRKRHLSYIACKVRELSIISAIVLVLLAGYFIHVATEVEGVWTWLAIVIVCLNMLSVVSYTLIFEVDVEKDAPEML